MEDKSKSRKNNQLLQVEYLGDMIHVGVNPCSEYVSDEWRNILKNGFSSAGVITLGLAVLSGVAFNSPHLCLLTGILGCGCFCCAGLVNHMQVSQRKDIDKEIEKFAESLSCYDIEKILNWKNEFKKNNSLLLHKKTLKLHKKQDFQQEM